MPTPQDTEFKVRFDVAAQADAGTLNRNLVTAHSLLDDEGYTLNSF